MDKDNLNSCVDFIDNMDEELTHLINMIYIMEIGIEKNPFGSKKYEAGCVHVINKYLDRLRKDYILPAREAIVTVANKISNEEIEREDTLE